MEILPPAPPARLFFILARRAPVGVIFRRGPSKWVQIVKWNTATDEFEEGQWFHGRIYEKRCDLSPDGSKLIYFAQKITKKSIADKEYTYAWTAISKPPYLTALTLWPKGDCWNGGGLFESEKIVWLNHPATAQAHKDHPAPVWLKVDAAMHYRGEDNTVFAERLVRDGWMCSQEWKGDFAQSGANLAFDAKGADLEPSEADWLREIHLEAFLHDAKNYGYVTFCPIITNKVAPSKRQTLVMTTAFVGMNDVRKYQVRGHDTGVIVPIVDADWADWDLKGRIVYAKSGKIMAARIDGSVVHETELADLNDNKRTGVKAPPWACTW